MMAGSAKSNFYTGRFSFAIDEKRRTQVPAKWRSSNPEAEYMIVLWRHPVGNCLRVLDTDGLERLRQRLEGMPDDNPHRDSFRRLYGSNSDVIQLHSGRITLPIWLAELAGLKDEALLVGVFNCFEIWNPELFKQSEMADRESTKDVVFSF